MLRFLPWKFIVQRAARAYGFMDPALWVARVRNFSQPSEVQEPIELLRAGVIFHARGLVNVKAIQHNLDWVWPYWVERQFDPADVSFIPRAFSFSHVNLTHRNWTAVGLPELSLYPIVDPRGLLTPIQDGWSLDCWLLDGAGGGASVLPSRVRESDVRQQLITDGDLAVATSLTEGESRIDQIARVVVEAGQPVVELSVRARSPHGGRLVVAIRPYNPEGVQFIDTISARETRDGWTVNDRHEVLFDRPADAVLTSDYAGGDVFGWLTGVATEAEPGQARPHPPGQVHCKTGMATAASIYNFTGPETEVTVRVPLAKELTALGNASSFRAATTWPMALANIARLRIPDGRMQRLYDGAVRTLVLLSADDIVPGPYTYRRFWFRDACLMMNAMLAVGLHERCGRAIAGFPKRQLRNGYFRSQEGEWDSNGQVLWILDRYAAITGEAPSIEQLDAITKAVSWISHKREPSAAAEGGATLHAGLLPPGFSAEHLGPNDYYYWDDFWAEAGLRAAARLFLRAGREPSARRARNEADDLRAAIDRSIRAIPPRRSMSGIPASPYRRLDSGAVGSLVADYPLQLTPPGDPQIMATVEGLLRTSFHNGGFFQEIIHSGVNAYLTLDVAQTLLRAGDLRYRDLLETVAAIASPTGQWPEAIHPLSGGGCMGDGQHGWAAAEWVMMIRNMFVREEGDRLVIGSGLLPQWLEHGEELTFGPTLTPWGPVTVHVECKAAVVVVRIDARWRRTPPRVDVAIPGCQLATGVDCAQPVRVAPGAGTPRLAEASAALGI